MTLLITLFNYIGSSLLVVMSAYVIVDIMTSKYKVKGFIGRMLFLVVLIVAMART